MHVCMHQSSRQASDIQLHKVEAQKFRQSLHVVLLVIMIGTGCNFTVFNWMKSSIR